MTFLRIQFVVVALIGALAARAGAQPKLGMMSTFAGTGQSGYSGDGGPAIKAKLSEPFHCDIDRAGNLYIAESANHCVRKVDRITGKISTVAGTGQKGYTGDDGKATQATFNEPYAVAVTAENDIYIVDRLNAVVRMVAAKTGIISTVAGTGMKGYSGDGGKATKAMLREPNDCCLDGKGGLLIADVADWRIRRLDLATGIITTFAGTGRTNITLKTKIDRATCGDGGPAAKAVIVGARAVCVDGRGNTYICEREGSAVRKVDAKGIITTIAGTGKWGFSGDGADAKRAVFAGPKGIRCGLNHDIFVVDCENHAIRQIDARSNVVRTVAGGRKGPGGDGGSATEAGLDRPHGCIIGADGILYIADTNNHRVRALLLRTQHP